MHDNCKTCICTCTCTSCSINKPERTNIYSCITWFRHTKRRLVIQYACLIWISTKKSESWGFANGSRAHTHKVPLNTFGNVKLPFNFIHTISQTIELRKFQKIEASGGEDRCPFPGHPHFYLHCFSLLSNWVWRKFWRSVY